jgi:hypothetical protein
MVEVDRTADEPGTLKPYNPASEYGAGEIAAVEDHTGEVEVEALPRHCRVWAQMGADETDDGVAYLPVSPRRTPAPPPRPCHAPRCRQRS